MEVILNRPLSIIKKHLKIFFLWFLFSSWLLPPLPITGHRSPRQHVWMVAFSVDTLWQGLSSSACSSVALALRKPEVGMGARACVCVCVFFCVCVYVCEREKDRKRKTEREREKDVRELPSRFHQSHSLQFDFLAPVKLDCDHVIWKARSIPSWHSHFCLVFIISFLDQIKLLCPPLKFELIKW